VHGKPILVIKAGSAERRYWRDLWQFRELFYFLAWRDILVRYKQTVMGVLWALIRPLVAIVVFTVIFGKLAKLPSDGVPYPVLVCAAMLPWQFFASAFVDIGNSLVGNANLISKIYFPRLVVPASTVLVALVDFLISLLILAGLMAWYGLIPDWRILTLPLFVFVAAAAAFGTGLWIAALNVKYRDFRHLIPFLVQIGLYVSPVGFSSAVVPDRWRLLYSLNPMVGVIDGFRWSLLGGSVQLYWPGFALSMLLIAMLLVGGIAYFRRTERTFVDVI
jgi:homopolymeric O-antigen transport system permease protein